ncbi:hypothetical protein G6L37_05805 [Agrobacterium rubi]|nr:hypothetical protein [Agrobacterium rubi]NTF24874.1 hypothetical protein [Agrobacterium rubi]
MQKKLWSEVDFSDWMSECGLSSKQAAVILGVSEITVIRNRNGQTAVKDVIARKAMAYRTASVTTLGADGDLLDAMAAQADVADLVAEFEHASITGRTSAILRGWTSENIWFHRQLRQPERRPVPKEWNGLSLEWYPANPLDLVSDIECRNDREGRAYRIASIERTLVDLAVMLASGDIVDDEFNECWSGAFASGGQVPDIHHVRALADRFGVGRIIEAHL